MVVTLNQMVILNLHIRVQTELNRISRFSNIANLLSDQLVLQLHRGLVILLLGQALPIY